MRLTEQRRVALIRLAMFAAAWLLLAVLAAGLSLIAYAAGMAARP